VIEWIYKKEFFMVYHLMGNDRYEERIGKDQVLDYIPVVSTINNIVDFFQKRVYKKPGFEPKPWDEVYCEHIKNKSTLRLVVASIPILGNITVAIYDLINASQRSVIYNSYMNNRCNISLDDPRYSKYRSDLEIVPWALFRNPSNFEFVCDRFKKNKNFILHSPGLGENLQYIDSELLNDVDFFLDALQVFDPSLCIQYFDESVISTVEENDEIKERAIDIIKLKIMSQILWGQQPDLNLEFDYDFENDEDVISCQQFYSFWQHASSLDQAGLHEELKNNENLARYGLMCGRIGFSSLPPEFQNENFIMNAFNEIANSENNPILWTYFGRSYNTRLPGCPKHLFPGSNHLMENGRFINSTNLEMKKYLFSSLSYTKNTDPQIWTLVQQIEANKIDGLAKSTPLTLTEDAQKVNAEESIYSVLSNTQLKPLKAIFEGAKFDLEKIKLLFVDGVTASLTNDIVFFHSYDYVTRYDWDDAVDRLESYRHVTLMIPVLRETEDGDWEDSIVRLKLRFNDFNERQSELWVCYIDNSSGVEFDCRGSLTKELIQSLKQLMAGQTVTLHNNAKLRLNLPAEEGIL
jgi:hypothetical protein